MSQTAIFSIKGIPVYGDLVLAPMDGFSDPPFRLICREFGSALSYSGFINALDVLNPGPRLRNKLTFSEQERPFVYQIFDSEPVRLLEAGLRLRDKKPDMIDINMGCSVRSVSGRGAGAGLLREPGKAARAVLLLARAMEDIPISAKIRLGWDENSRNYLDIAHAIEESGGSLIAVHGRSRKQGFSGKVDLDAIAEIKQAVSIPVIANGDVCTSEDINHIKRHTGCDAVMIGRGAIGNPWIFSRIDRGQVPDSLVRHTMKNHLEKMVDFYGEALGLRLFRKHLSRYLTVSNIPKEARQQLLTVEKLANILDLLSDISL